MKRPLWVHEDDIAQVQFLPSACRDFCLDQFERIKQYSAAHRAPNGVGWTKMYRIPPTPVSLAALKVSVGDLAAAMPWRMRRVRQVLTGTWSEDGAPLERTAAYMSGSAAIVFSWNESGIVQFLWYHDAALSAWRRGPMMEAFFRLGILAPLLLVDWRGTLVDLGDRKAIRAYLAGKPLETDTAVRETPSPPAPVPPALLANSLYRFEAPVRPALCTRKRAAGLIFAVIDTLDGRAWSVSIDPAALSTGDISPPVPVRPAAEGLLSEWWDIAEARIMALQIYGQSERAAIWDSRDGTTICDRLEAMTAVLTPDGRYALLFEEAGIAVKDLLHPRAPARQSGLFPNFQEEKEDGSSDFDPSTLDSPGSIMAMARGPDDGDITLAIGDYGFAVVATVRIGDDGEAPLTVVEGPHAFFEGLVYDPVTIVDVIPGDSLIVHHGHGAGIACFDLRTGTVNDCPLPEEPPQPRYGAFRRAVLATDKSGLWVETDRGPHFWDWKERLRPVSREAGQVLATDGDHYLAISPDGWDLVAGRFSDPNH